MTKGKTLIALAKSIRMVRDIRNEGHHHPYLLVGESPNRASENRPELWLLPDGSGTPHSANRLLDFSGMSLERYLRTFERTNVLDYCPPRTGGPGKFARGRQFDLKEARDAARRIVRRAFDEDRKLVILGKRAASAFAWVDDFGTAVGAAALGYLHWGSVVVPDTSPERDVPAAIVPHPSGVNVWWNDDGNRAAARKFLRRLG